jgi:ADP-ribosylglycohydrolase
MASPAGPRIAAALVAFACGDAFGLPWEGSAAGTADLARAEELPPRPGWPAGSTSDDTALTLLVARHLVERRGDGDALALASLISAHADGIRGLGPSTSRAVEHFRGTGRLPTGDGNTNGAVMRALPIGWATPLAAARRRRHLTVTLSEVTHPGAEACAAACVAAACAAWSVDADARVGAAGGRRLLAVAAGEAEAAVRACAADAGLVWVIDRVAAGTWAAPPGGVGLDPYVTLAAALHCVHGAGSLPEVLQRALVLGGDTDTVAAVAGGLAGAFHTVDQVRALLPWSGAVRLPSATVIDQLGADLAFIRAQVM